VDGAAVGFPGAVQIFRIERQIDTVRKGQVTGTTVISVYGVTSLSADEASPQRLLELVREYWAIEIKQHYRRDHTQREDHCLVRHPVAARNLALLRSAAIFLIEQQRFNGSSSDFQPQNLQSALISQGFQALPTLFKM
jgi:predicted transposase YbfD/YdcC